MDDATQNEPGCHCSDGLYWNEYTEKCGEVDQCGCVVLNTNTSEYFVKGDTHPMSCSK